VGSSKEAVAGFLYPCEWPECGKAARIEINAQWTVVDFMGVATCTQHFLEFWDGLLNMRVNGELPREMWTDVFDLAEENDR
jgi:hypothetical protein